MNHQITFTQADRRLLVSGAFFGTGVFVKKSRVLAVQMLVPFRVETDRGIMTGRAGDWLVTNHPDDDPNSDLWSVSADRMDSTYEPAPTFIESLS